MAIMVQDSGAASILNAYFNNTWAAGGKNIVMHLFTNNVTPADTDTAGTYTEASGGGYSAITLNNGSWTVSSVGSIEQAAYAAQTFTFTGALTGSATVYGYYVVDASGTLLFSELLAAPFKPANNGDNIQITPTFQASHGTPTT